MCSLLSSSVDRARFGPAACLPRFPRLDLASRCAAGVVLALAMVLPARAQCTGDERLSASCRVRATGNKLQGKVTNGVAGQRVLFCYDGGNCVTKFFNNRGKAKASWSGVADGPHFVLAKLPCGQDLTDMTSCATSPYDVQFQHVGTINGQNFVILGSGLADPATGVSIVTWDIEGLDPACDPLAVVIPTQEQCIGAATARQDGARNMLNHSGGFFDVEIIMLELTSVASVNLSGSTLYGSMQSHGNLYAPALDGAAPNTLDWLPRPRSGQIPSFQSWFFDPSIERDYVGVLADVIYHPGNGQDLPQKQEQTVKPQETYAYDGLSRLVRTVRSEDTVRPGGQAKRCHFWTATAPDENCAACPVAGGTTVCGKECSSDNDCAGYTANFACAGGGNCKVSYNPSGCSPCP